VADVGSAAALADPADLALEGRAVLVAADSVERPEPVDLAVGAVVAEVAAAEQPAGLVVVLYSNN